MELSVAGPDDLEFRLRTESEIPLAYGSGKDFPDWAAMSQAAAATTEPASDRPAGPVMQVEAEVSAAGVAHAEETRGEKTAGATPGPQDAAGKMPLRNPGLETLRLADVRPGEGVSIPPGQVTEVAPGGVAILRCVAVALEQPGPFSRRIEIENNDPNNPVAAIALSGILAAGAEISRHAEHADRPSEQALGSIRSRWADKAALLGLAAKAPSVPIRVIRGSNEPEEGVPVGGPRDLVRVHFTPWLRPNRQRMPRTF